jgi:glycerol-3-phosphate dehydrogenase (NAD(P)+)
MSDAQTPVAVIGAGAWGTTIGWMLAERGMPVRLWAVTQDLAAEIEQRRENVTYLPGVRLPEGLTVSADGPEVLADAATVIWVVPSVWLRETAVRLAPCLVGEPLMISATKGLERGSGLRMSQVLAEELGAQWEPEIVALSGPNLSGEIVRRMPALSVAASTNQRRAHHAQGLLSSPLFRVYRNYDIIGVELCGALKNVIAIAAGVSDGLGYGDNAKAALITRGLAEMRRLGVKLGAHPETFAGVAGMGDLITTCASTLSRNYSTGQRLAAGESCEEIQASMKAVAEGIFTTQAEVELAERVGVEVPIAQAVHAVLFEGLDPGEGAAALMTREQKAEY